MEYAEFRRGAAGYRREHSTLTTVSALKRIVYKVIRQVLNGVEVRTAGELHQSSPFPNSEGSLWQKKPNSVDTRLLILENRVWSQTMDIRDCHWMLNIIYLSALRSNYVKPCFSSKRISTPLVLLQKRNKWAKPIFITFCAELSECCLKVLNARIWAKSITLLCLIFFFFKARPLKWSIII